MYRSKHQKGYTTSHEVKTTRFRTWKSGKKWLYGATVLTLKQRKRKQHLFHPEHLFQEIQVMTQEDIPTLELNLLILQTMLYMVKQL